MTASALHPHPTLPAPARRRIIVFATIVSVLGGLGSVFVTALFRDYPLVLVGLSPDIRHFALIAPYADIYGTLLVGTPRRVAGMVAAYYVGLGFGRRALDYLAGRYPRVQQWLAWLERLLVRLGPVFLVVWSSYTLNTLAGVNRIRFGRYFVATTFGQVIYILYSYYLGQEIADSIAPITDWLSAHVVECTIVLALAFGIYQLRATRRRRRFEAELVQAEQEKQKARANERAPADAAGVVSGEPL